MKEPYKLLDEIALLGVPFVVVDKMPLIKDAKDRITVQHVPASIYKASYPAWFFSREKFYEFISLHYEVKADFDRDVRTNIEAVFKGLLLSKKK
jgi:hypothetical protein